MAEMDCKEMSLFGDELQEEVRFCNDCKEWKPVSKFLEFTDKKNGKRYWKTHCRPCGVIRSTRWRSENLSRDRQRRRRVRLKKEHGISIGKYNEMADAQNNLCAICHLPEKLIRFGRVDYLAVDHDHGTGAIRGLLCSLCNQGLGYFKDTPKLLREAANYLERYKK